MQKWFPIRNQFTFCDNLEFIFVPKAQVSNIAILKSTLILDNLNHPPNFTLQCKWANYHEVFCSLMIILDIAIELQVYLN